MAPASGPLQHLPGRGHRRGSPDPKFAGEKTTAVIGDHTTIRECCTINRGTTDRMTTKVGSHCLLMAYTHIAHDAFVGDHCVLANCASIAGHVTMRIGSSSRASSPSSSSSESASMPSWRADRSCARTSRLSSRSRGNPELHRVNAIGLRRRGFPDEFVPVEYHRTLYVTGGNMSKAIKVAEMELPISDAKGTILDFIRASDKGIVRGPF